MGYPYYKELIFMSLQYLFVIRKLERNKTITPNSGRPNINCKDMDFLLQKKGFTSWNLLLLKFCENHLSK